MPLSFVRLNLKERHTGVYLAETVHLIVQKFGVQNKVFHHLSTLTLETMIKEIKK
ncbi:hypothetical protein PSTG_10759 [Puccinia striiformis f. sp. tritici PST-78]|uniref:Uncharacterized protein n=1 Tax=Puccinia striiformis f. sp. tritici PST-78 TaxID=1165861 RepID=A0A0L0V9K8_9BASI|nr:hypothetical protein PSTG_10759 [Puccinia striiformis f. sp. tritici PST-78]